ncbi:CARDB domain-containing protein [Chloroflexota bacterium]
MSHFIICKKILSISICLMLSSTLIFSGCGGTAPISETEDEVEDTVVEETAAKPARFTFKNLTITPKETKIRDNVEISALVTNEGDETGAFTVELRINGKVADYQDVTLAGGSGETVTFQNAQKTDGEYTVSIGNLSDSFTVIPPPEKPESGDSKPSTPSTPTGLAAHGDWTIPEGTGTNFRAVHMGGNWGTTRDAAPVLPEEYFEYLRDLNVNWVGISVALHLDSSMDSTVELDSSNSLSIPTFKDDVLRKMIQTYCQHGFNVYIALAFESLGKGEYPLQRWQLGDPFAAQEDDKIAAANWPWYPSHPDHEEFVAEFWDSYKGAAVHIGQIAQEEGATVYCLGTETDRLFRSRSGGQWPNHFKDEMQAMVDAVREVYSGSLGYEVHYEAVVNRDFFGPGSDYLFKDLGLDFVGVSAYFQLSATHPSGVMTLSQLESAWETVFQQHLIPLQQRNPGKPIIFTEFGYTDSIVSPHIANADEFQQKQFKDKDGNGLDDGEETQANCIEAFFNKMDQHEGVVTGAFIWGLQMATDSNYEKSFGNLICFNIRNKVAADLVRQHYALWR